MTATPLREDNRDTYLYFGNPIYEYSLRQGIEDGFLAPYRVHRVITEWDAAGWRPSKDELDRYGRVIPDGEYQTKDFERVVVLLARTEAIAKHLTNFLKKTDRFAKTIVFCVDQEHADAMRRALGNLNADLVRQHPDYVCRVTSDEGDVGRGHLDRFQDVESQTPVILTTSQMLTTGVDVPTCKNIVLARVIRYTDYAAEKVRNLCPSAPELRARWADLRGRSEIIERLAERGVGFEELADAAGQPEADPFDLLCHFAFNAPLRTRRERAQRLQRERKDFFDRFGPEARAILNELLEKYAQHGDAQFLLPDILKVPPISDHGQPFEIITLFGGQEPLRLAVTELQNLLYAA
jgi:type I site-specific restriction endonuclease